PPPSNCVNGHGAPCVRGETPARVSVERWSGGMASCRPSASVPAAATRRVSASPGCLAVRTGDALRRLQRDWAEKCRRSVKHRNRPGAYSGSFGAHSGRSGAITTPSGAPRQPLVARSGRSGARSGSSGADSGALGAHSGAPGVGSRQPGVRSRTSGASNKQHSSNTGYVKMRTTKQRGEGPAAGTPPLRGSLWP
ncbi:hypothetical protein OpiT1DRAFT_01657, partial [Opitutaceae bacterium TAV1]